VFLGTPHRGSRVADWSSIVTGIAKVMFLGRPRKLLDDLKTNCKALSDISEDFINIVSRFTIKSFFEENRLNHVIIVCASYHLKACTNHNQVVNKDSATMKITQEEAIPMEGDHRQIARFSGPDDDRFQAL
jgi:predicted nucleotide-binding protein (sugar kinase/HSP70/actin superfamily)